MAFDYSELSGYGDLANYGAGTLIFSGIICIFMIICMWKIFAKAGQPGWGSLIPIYNIYLEFKIAYGNGWSFLLMLIPIVNIVIAIMLIVRLGQSFGKSGGFIAGMFFLSIIFLPILAFDSSTYIGSKSARKEQNMVA